MCHAHSPQAARFGSALEHGAAHTEDHGRWSRRDFLTVFGTALAGTAFSLHGTAVRAYGQAPLLAQLQAANPGRILVLVQLNGGNDGLNTVVPFRNDVYYRDRPTLAIPPADLLPLTSELGLHPSLAPLQRLLGDGRMAVVQNVGYPAPNLSHFRSTDIWMSASDSDTVETTGWTGRYLDHSFPGFEETPSDYPLAVQIGGSTSMLFQGPDARMGMSISSLDLFERLAEKGLLYEREGLPQASYGREMHFLRGVANDSYGYAGAIQTAAQAGRNRATYPSGNRLAESLAVVSRLIKGNLGAHIYHVSLGGFDTHANQRLNHANLLRLLAEALNTFHLDLSLEGRSEEVMIMTFSEFGRRVAENGSAGTDHGVAAPLFLFGDSVQGGVVGQAPRLEEKNVPFEIDFRSAYTTVLQDWFGLDAAAAAGILGGDFARLGVVSQPVGTAATDAAVVPSEVTLAQNYPNPFNPTTTLQYGLPAAGPVRLSVYDVQGRRVALLVDRVEAAGQHTVAFDAGDLPSGTYFYRLQTAAGQQSRQMTLVR